MDTYPQIIDANINRIAEGLRVLEEYTRFIANHKKATKTLQNIRYKLNKTHTLFQEENLLNCRNTEQDSRAKEAPKKRESLKDLLSANFKRITEGLRVLEEYTGKKIYNTLRYDTYTLEKELILNLLKPSIQNGIYLISHDPDILKKGLDWQVSIIQLRIKDKAKSTILETAKKTKKLCQNKNIPFIVNDHLDIAQLVDADGLHTGQDDLPVSEIRKLLGPHKLIGKSAHNIEQGLAAEKEGADYVSVGPIWATPSKPGRKAIGFNYLKAAEKQLSIPYVAIGGINKENVAKVLAYKPPLIGLIRDHESIPEIQKYQKRAQIN